MQIKKNARISLFYEQAESSKKHINRYDLLRRLASECKNIKRSKLHRIDGEDKDVLKAIGSFERIERLELSICDVNNNNIASLVEHLPFLRHLEIIPMIICHLEWSFVLILLEQCQSLEKLILKM